MTMKQKTKKEFSEDYSKAQSIVNDLEVLKDTVINVCSIGAFRKYLYDLGRYENKAYTTRKESNTSLQVVRIK